MKYLFITIIFFYCSGCIKDYRSLYTATFINTTTHSINILFYKNGSVEPADTIKLLQGQEFEFAKGSVWGNVSVPGFTSKYFGSSDDSIIVVYDDLYKITHYANTPSQLAPKYYLFSSLRNIGNSLSYRFVSTPISRHNNNNAHYYDFTEQDYLDAK